MDRTLVLQLFIAVGHFETAVGHHNVYYFSTYERQQKKLTVRQWVMLLMCDNYEIIQACVFFSSAMSVIDILEI